MVISKIESIPRLNGKGETVIRKQYMFNQKQSLVVAYVMGCTIGFDGIQR